MITDNGDSMAWVYAKLYTNDISADWYANLLRRYLVPICRDNRDEIDSLFFTKYQHRYGDYENNLEDENGTIIPGSDAPKPDEIVRFIRVRLSVDNDTARKMTEMLLRQARKDLGSILRYYVFLEYDVNQDLGKRFGDEHLKDILGVFDGWCWFNLMTLRNDEDTQSSLLNDLFHLVNNISVRELMTECSSGAHPVVA